MKGILLVNLGSPDSTNVKDVKKYLDEFLMDERVLDMPYWKRFLIVKGIILNMRPKKTVEAYKKIWKEGDAPLIAISKKFTSKLQKKVDFPVELAMRYGSLSIEKGLTDLQLKGVDHVLVLPLYPHYAMSSYETVKVKVKEVIDTSFKSVKIEFFPVFYDNPDYIRVLSNSINKQLKGFEYDKLLFSYHGLPERHIYKADPTKGHCKLNDECCKIKSIAHKTCYRHQCFETTKKVAEKLKLKEKDYIVSFQSRLLKDPWLRPYTDSVLEELPTKGIKKLAVVAPAFVTDCLETLEEIAIEGKKTFFKAGGEEFLYLPCLNEDDEWVNIVKEWALNWINKN
jgi:ferrochelatase